MGVLRFGDLANRLRTTRAVRLTTNIASTIMSVLKTDMKTKVHMIGNMNGHDFVIDGEGTGNPFEGLQSMNLYVREGGPLPFAFDILIPSYMYGDRVFTKYPPEIEDYFKKSLPEGFKWMRSMLFEDNAVCTVSADIRMEGDTIYNETIHFHGVNFPPNSPVMQKKTIKWEPSTEKLYERDGLLKSDINMALLLQDGTHHRCDFTTTYIAKKDVRPLPKYHNIDHRLEIVKHDKDYNKVELFEVARAGYSTLPSKLK